MNKIERLLKNVDMKEPCTKNWKKKQKVEVLQATESNFSCITEGSFPGMWKRSFARTTHPKSFSQYFNFWKSTRKPRNKNLCLCRHLTLHLLAKAKLESETSKLLYVYLQNKEDVVAAKFQKVCINDIPTEDLTETNVFLYDIDIVDEPLVGELTGRSKA